MGYLATKLVYEGSLRATDHCGNLENHVAAASQQSKPIVCKWQGQKCVEKMMAEMGETSHRNGKKKKR